MKKPYDEFLNLIRDEETTILHDVVELVVKKHKEPVPNIFS